MPILALDQFGKIIVSDRDRSDGKGYGAEAVSVERRDNTLDNAYLMSERQNEAEIAYNKVANAVVDAYRRSCGFCRHFSTIISRSESTARLSMLMPGGSCSSTISTVSSGVAP